MSGHLGRLRNPFSDPLERAFLLLLINPGRMFHPYGQHFVPKHRCPLRVVTDVLATLCITRKTLSRYANDPRSGLPPSIKIGRTTYYSLRALNRWIRLRAGEDLDEFDHAA